MRKRSREAILAGFIYFPVMWVIEDLWQGIGYDRIFPTLLGAVVVGLFVYFLGWWLERRAQRKHQDQVSPGISD